MKGGQFVDFNDLENYSMYEKDIYVLNQPLFDNPRNVTIKR